MDNLLLTLAALTLGGSAAVAALALVSRSTRARYGARWRCWAWLLLCLRLAVPVSLAGLTHSAARTPIRLPVPEDTVVYHYAPSRPEPPSDPLPAGGTSAPNLPPAGQGNQGTSVSSPDTSAQEAGPDTAGTAAGDSGGFSLSASQLLLGIWLTGAGAMLLWALVSHARLLIFLRRWAVPVSDPEVLRACNQLGNRLGLNRRPRLMSCRGLRVPMLVGLFHPALLLPQEAPQGEALYCSLLHELTHYRRRDIWLKTLALWVNALHWFNPFMWYMVRLVERDTELACDEAALKALPAGERAAYGRTILSAAERLGGRRTA